MSQIHETAVVGDGCMFGGNVSIGKDCVLGDRVVLHENVVLYPGTVVGSGTEIFDNAVIGRPPRSAGNLVHKLKKDFASVKIGGACVIGAGVVLYADSILGEHVLIGDGAKIREGAVLEDYSLIAMNCTLNHDVHVKRGSKVMDLSHITACTVIEEGVFVGTLVSSSNDNTMRLRGGEVGAASAIHIHSGSRIGSCAALLPGVEIGANATVGAGAVVTKDVAPNSRVMGVPAKEK